MRKGERMTESQNNQDQPHKKSRWHEIWNSLAVYVSGFELSLEIWSLHVNDQTSQNSKHQSVGKSLRRQQVQPTHAKILNSVIDGREISAIGL